ncbi:MAG: sugar phosphate nucleotidyltransferase [Bacteroidales bacterium]|nr:sugar phosphate nucleotidyltransferase [Bacteroidales bacterium]MDD2322123.1 sugar phosphate nucleotidyltransferase [Bacteroidales bacterium]MDD3010864.1 sugar phosphate nucleotidyltransferase [Bacteroidales bacterium]MDD3961155.1 sugar phosphate nucleotidyltransferase [Bacteroidales bacterium]MDY0286960.1 sugar phosphate nucleotidyltransferase [Bacteroidales bacterium]
MNPTLVILAAGIGSRYGSVKQLDKMGPSGETLLDYSAYDAMRAGFGKIVFVIRKNIEEDFKKHVVSKIEKFIPCALVFQELQNVPEGIEVHPERVKPWGTGHAVLVAKDVVNENFAAINADDFYGYDAFKTMATHLKHLDMAEYSMVGYPIQKTLSEHGSVSRGVCSINESDYLEGIIERPKIIRENEKIKYQDENGKMQPLSGNETVSMNFWGFTPDIFDFIAQQFREFIGKEAGNPKSEIYIPFVVDTLIKADIRRAKVLKTKAEWFGITYKEDKEAAVKRLRSLTEEGEYPEKLWT